MKFACGIEVTRRYLSWCFPHYLYYVAHTNVVRIKKIRIFFCIKCCILFWFKWNQKPESDTVNIDAFRRIIQSIDTSILIVNAFWCNDDSCNVLIILNLKAYDDEKSHFLEIQSLKVFSMASNRLKKSTKRGMRWGTIHSIITKVTEKKGQRMECIEPK